MRCKNAAALNLRGSERSAHRIERYDLLHEQVMEARAASPNEAYLGLMILAAHERPW